MKKSLVPQIVLFSIAAMLVNYLVYFAFISTYTNNQYSEDAFIEHYSNDIYSYRVLSKPIVLGTYRLLGEAFPNSGNTVINESFYSLGANFSKKFYITMFLVNTLFFVLTIITFVFIFNNYLINLTQKEKILLQLAIVFFVAITQYVVVPYDMIGYFLQAMFILLLLSKAKYKLFYLGLIIAISTLNRESSALLISIAATAYYMTTGANRDTVKKIIFLTLFFLVPYIALRFMISVPDNNVISELTFLSNFTVKRNLVGIAIWIVFFAISLILTSDRKAKKAIYIFHLFSLPYIITCFTGAVMFETRLYIPILLGSLVLCQMNFEKIGKDKITPNEQ